MKEYINKANVVAMIRKLKIDIGNIFNDYDDGFWEGRTTAFDDIICALDTLEAKEVDLDKEARHYLLHEHKSPLSAVFHQTDLHSELQYHKDIENAFKAGFKLGLKENCPITANDRGMAEEIIINLKRIEKDYRIDLTKEIEWLRNKTQKKDKS